jgi:hypothetical protein
MKYVLLFCGTPEDQVAFDALSQGDRAERYAQVGRWFAQHGSVITASSYPAAAGDGDDCAPGERRPRS